MLFRSRRDPGLDLALVIDFFQYSYYTQFLLMIYSSLQRPKAGQSMKDQYRQPDFSVEVHDVINSYP